MRNSLKEEKLFIPIAIYNHLVEFTIEVKKLFRIIAFSKNLKNGRDKLYRSWPATPSARW